MLYLFILHVNYIVLVFPWLYFPSFGDWVSIDKHVLSMDICVLPIRTTFLNHLNLCVFIKVPILGALYNASNSVCVHRIHPLSYVAMDFQ